MSNYAWKKENTRNIVLGLNKNTCADVLAVLDTKPSKQAYILELIRADIAKQNRAAKRAKKAE